MDFEAAFDQVLTLLSPEPGEIYTSFYYRKQTKNQWARDDPAFIVIQAMFVAISSLAFAVAFRHPSFWGYLWSTLYSLLFDWLLVGFIVTSTCTHVANKYMRQNHAHSVEQEVEWLYAFDVHANAFFCSFIITYVVQYFLLPILLSRSVFSCVLSNALYAVATIWYAYITHLGYRGTCVYIIYLCICAYMCMCIYVGIPLACGLLVCI
ncbi:UNC-50 [Ochromonadaceae sp. CCMP2298]|nr:UNC-50 [Ochromonadaceae sp. CCMP2298]